MPEIKFVEKKGAVQSQPLTVAICIPGNNFSGTFFRHWTVFLMECISRGINPVLCPGEDAVVYYARNKCLGGSVLRGKNQKPYDGKFKYDYMLWIDSDIIFSFWQFAILLNRMISDKSLSIVSGLYMTADSVTYPVVIEWDTEFFKANGYFQFLKDDDIKDKKDLIEVVYTGFGFLLARYGVFESIEYPWFRPITHNLSETITDFSSEDVSFCQIAREKGHKIFIDPTVIVGHEKRKVILPQRLSSQLS